MMKLPTLLSLTLTGFFWSPEPVDDERPEKIFNLPRDCLKIIHSFDELCFVGPCCLSCFKMFHIAYDFEKTAQINKMIERCRISATGAKHKQNYFSFYLDDEEKDELCKDLENWKELLKEAPDLYYKYRKTLPLEGSDDYKKVELLESYKKMHKRLISKQNIFYEKQTIIYKKQIGALKFCKALSDSSDTESNSTASTMDTIFEGCQSESD